jgi:hypothetical protein
MSRMTVLDLLLRQVADEASRMLDSAERDAVCGDLAESGESGLQTLREVMSLVVRRSAARLRGWRPWLTLFSLTVPLSVLVSLVSRRTADGTAIYLWLYVHQSDSTIIHNPGFWRELARNAPGLLLSYLALTCWSWTTGLLVGCFARRTLWFSGAVFFVVVLTVGFFGIPHFFGHVLVLRRVRNLPSNAAVFFQAFYRQLLPQWLQLLLVALPAWRGMLQGRRMDRFPRTAQVFLLIAAAAAIGTLVSTNLLWWQMRVWDIWPLRQPRLPSMTPLAIVGPGTYLVLTSLTRRTRRRGKSTDDLSGCDWE